MEIAKLSEEAIDALRSSGWTPDRQVDVGGVVKSQTDTGFTVERAAYECLTQFVGLRVHFDKNNWLAFDAEQSGSFYNASSVEGLVRLFGSPICRLGQIALADPRSTFF